MFIEPQLTLNYRSNNAVTEPVVCPVLKQLLNPVATVERAEIDDKQTLYHSIATSKKDGLSSTSHIHWLDRTYEGWCGHLNTDSISHLQLCVSGVDIATLRSRNALVGRENVHWLGTSALLSYTYSSISGVRRISITSRYCPMATGAICILSGSLNRYRETDTLTMNAHCTILLCR